MIRRGDIYFLSLDPVRGREQAGYRPVLVVSSNFINSLPLVVTIVVGTDGKNVPDDYPTNVRVGSKESGLPKDTVFLCFQVRSLDPVRFREPRAKRVGSLSQQGMKQIEDAIRLVLVL